MQINREALNFLYGVKLLISLKVFNAFLRSQQESLAIGNKDSVIVY